MQTIKFIRSSRRGLMRVNGSKLNSKIPKLIIDKWIFSILFTITPMKKFWSDYLKFTSFTYFVSNVRNIQDM